MGDSNFCRKSESADSALRVAIAGGDGFLNTVLRAFVDLSAKKPKGWQVYGMCISRL